MVKLTLGMMGGGEICIVVLEERKKEEEEDLKRRDIPRNFITLSADEKRKNLDSKSYRSSRKVFFIYEERKKGK